MSKLTNCQIRAQIEGLVRGCQAAAERGDKPGVRRRLLKITMYRSILAAREAAGENPGTGIQAVRFGEGGRA